MIKNLVSIYTVENDKYKDFYVSTRRDDLYTRQMIHFINCVLGKEESLVDIGEGKKTLKIVLVAKRSADTKKTVVIQ